jgi:ubiquinol-cytochrome c reductase cytochrome c1 subunit
MKKFVVSLAIAVAASLPAYGSTSDAKAPVAESWKHAGFFGTFDRAAVQRGYLVYKDVCASCHSLKYISFRNLPAIGFSEAEAKAIAATYTVKDGPNDDGEMFERPGRPSDRFPSPNANDKAARAANNGALPPDLSLIVKARANGANYVYSLLIGYADAPADVKLGDGMSYNPYFSGMQIGMPNPLAEDQVSFTDGTKASVKQMSKDVVSFLAWAAEPDLEARNAMGIKVSLFLLIAIGLTYAAMRRVWAALH